VLPSPSAEGGGFLPSCLFYSSIILSLVAVVVLWVCGQRVALSKCLWAMRSIVQQVRQIHRLFHTGFIHTGNPIQGIQHRRV
jgi:hypothetical protein